ncbi:hypothetical protein VTO42DRAFT_2159 [Malbranchea cinnamomea]
MSTWDPQKEVSQEAGKKSYVYTKAEVDRQVKETLIKDSKIDACLLKFHKSYIEALRDDVREQLWTARFDGSDLKDPQTYTLLQDTLVNDIEHLLPGYWQEIELASATLEEKFAVVQGRYKSLRREFRDLPKNVAGKGFIDTLRDVLSEKRARELVAAEESFSSGAPSLLRSSQLAALKDLRSSIEGEQATAMFACGGSIAITMNAEQNRNQNEKDVTIKDKEMGKKEKNIEHGGQEDGDDSQLKDAALLPRESPPIQIFWSSPDGRVQKIWLPCPNEDQARTTSTIDTLVNDCSPATFGRGDKDVLDTNYRHAGKLDPVNFCTSFHPADFGILDMIEQTLLPSVSSPEDNELQFRRVRAELYKLNIYSGPSGLFRAHVDTPRSDSQFGSLVVCLPSHFKGGNLEIRHNGQVVDFDWSDLSSSHIQWAAFYGDCEHEISKVTEGHRVTLTYNLYVTEPVGAGLLPRPPVDPSSFPLYGKIRALLDQPGFFQKGGVLGFFCSHSYAHTSFTAKRSLPRKLKGSDLALFAVLKSLGLSVDVLPVLERNGEYFTANEFDLDTENKVSTETEHSNYLTTSFYCIPERTVDFYRENGYMVKEIYGWGKSQVERTPLELFYLWNSHDLDASEDLQKLWKTILVSREPLNCPEHNFGAFIGTTLHPYKTTDGGGEDYSSDEVSRDEWPHYFLPGITWVTSPKQEQMALSHLCYGNEAWIGSRYSCAAIIAVVPPYCQRQTSL